VVGSLPRAITNAPLTFRHPAWQEPIDFSLVWQETSLWLIRTEL